MESGDSSTLWIYSIVGAAIFFVWIFAPDESQPCVYEHGMIVDRFWHGAGKRTCQELISEANSRIETLQVQLNARAEAPTLAPEPLDGEPISPEQ